MKKKPFLLISIFASISSILGTLVLPYKNLYRSIATHEHVGYHYLQKNPTPYESGIHEYWVCCDCHEHFLTKPDGIFTDRTVPNDFSVSQNDDRYFPSYQDCELSGMKAANSQLSGFNTYTVSENTSDFLSANSDAHIGLLFEKNKTMDVMARFLFDTNVYLEPLTEYQMTMVIDRFPGPASAYSALRVAIKDIFRSGDFLDDNSHDYPCNGYDYKTTNIAPIDDSEIILSTYSEIKDEATGGYVFTEMIKFKTGIDVPEKAQIDVLVNYQSNLGKCGITKLIIEKVDNSLDPNRDHLFGMCNLSYDMDSDQIDSGVNNEWSAKKMGALGVKSTRLWMYIFRLIKKSTVDDSVSLIKSKADLIHAYISELKKQGVDRFVGMVNGFITPYDFNPPDSTSALYVEDDRAMYIRFMKRMETSFKLIAEEFPEIEYWEIENEPDISSGSWFHRKDHTPFTSDEAAYITADLNWYASRAIKSVNPNAKILLGGITDDVNSPAFLDKIYTNIESGNLPTGESNFDKNPDNYFDILAWHPYPSLSSSLSSFIAKEENMYNVAIAHGDEGKKVFYTEFGFSDYRFGGKDGEDGVNSTQDDIARKMINCFDIINSRLEFVDTVMVFRLTNIYQMYRDGSWENSFGVFYSPNDTRCFDDGTLRAGYPKPVALKLFKFFNASSSYPNALFEN